MQPFDLIGPGDKGYLHNQNNVKFILPPGMEIKTAKVKVTSKTPTELKEPAIKLTQDVQLITDVGNAITEFLLAKNTKYGNSALEPLRTFSKADSEEQLLIRMDDKLSRIKNAEEPKMNDMVDLTGYLLLYIIKKGWTDKIKEMID